MAQLTQGRESTTLLSYLSAQRDHVRGILEGLDEGALRPPVLPSRWTCLGLVRHLALDVERFWFRGIAAGEQIVIDGLAAAPDDAWHVGSDVPASTRFLPVWISATRTIGIGVRRAIPGGGASHPLLHSGPASSTGRQRLPSLGLRRTRRANAHA